jgi:hypothetical protein
MKTRAQYQAGLRPNGVAAQLARLATRLSGPMRAVQPPAAAWHAHRLWSPCGGHKRGDAVAQPMPTEERSKHGEVFVEGITERRGYHRTRAGGRKLTIMAGRR